MRVEELPRTKRLKSRALFIRQSPVVNFVASNQLSAVNPSFPAPSDTLFQVPCSASTHNTIYILAEFLKAFTEIPSNLLVTFTATPWFSYDGSPYVQFRPGPILCERLYLLTFFVTYFLQSTRRASKYIHRLKYYPLFPSSEASSSRETTTPFGMDIIATNL